MNNVRDLPQRLPRPSRSSRTDDTARRVSLMHEAANVAQHTPLAPTNEGRLATLIETAGYAAAAVRDHGDDLRATLLALNVQTQLWLNDIDRDRAA